MLLVESDQNLESNKIPIARHIFVSFNAKDHPFILNFERNTPFLPKSRNPQQGKYQILKFSNINIF